MSWIEHLHSTNWDHATSVFFCTYLLGCFTSGYYLVRWVTGKDIREIGSGNVGARNVGRVLGKTGFSLTVFFDFGKGMLAVWAVRHFMPDDELILTAMLGVVAGHIWPAQLRFRGGKGMATSLGSLVVYDPQLALTFAILFFCLFALSRRSVLPGLFALACVPFADMALGDTPEKIIFLSIWAGLVLLAHRKNFVEEFAQLTARRRHQHDQTL